MLNIRWCVIYAAEDGGMVLNDRTSLFSKVTIKEWNTEDVPNGMYCRCKTQQCISIYVTTKQFT